MKYITKVGDTHVIEINGVNHSVEFKAVEYSGDKDPKYVFPHVSIREDLTVHAISRGTHLSEIVLAVEIARFIKENKK